MSCICLCQIFWSAELIKIQFCVQNRVRQLQCYVKDNSWGSLHQQYKSCGRILLKEFEAEQFETSRRFWHACGLLSRGKQTTDWLILPQSVWKQNGQVHKRQRAGGCNAMKHSHVVLIQTDQRKTHFGWQRCLCDCWPDLWPVTRHCTKKRF